MEEAKILIVEIRSERDNWLRAANRAREKNNHGASVQCTSTANLLTRTIAVLEVLLKRKERFDMRYIFDGYLTETDISLIENQHYAYPILLSELLPLSWFEDNMTVMSNDTRFVDCSAVMKIFPTVEIFPWKGGGSAVDPSAQPHFYFFRSFEDKEKILQHFPEFVIKKNPFQTIVNLKRPIFSMQIIYRLLKSLRKN